MADPILLSLVWHMHQPSYRDALTGRVLLPWTRLHATKDYRDMVTSLRGHPDVHATFNLTPVLLEQLEAIAAGRSDDYLDLARKPANSLLPEDLRFLIRHFFSVHPTRMLEPYPRYRELKARCATPVGGGRAARERPLTAGETRDLQTWFHLAWVDPVYHGEEPVRSLLAKGRDFTEQEKTALLDWGVACAGNVIGAYVEAERAGQVELTTSAYHHPLLPLLIDTEAPREVSRTIPLPALPFRAPEDAVEHVRRAREAHARRFGAPPRGTWPPEGAVNQATLVLLREAGFEWCASDENVLARALGRSESGGEDWPAFLCRPYRVDTPSGPLAIIFRDRDLSDRIGFTYMAWEPERAAEDFVARVLDRGTRARAHGASQPLVSVILDGENCWESYPEDGRGFLDALYRRIAGEPALRAVTVGEALARIPRSEVLAHVPVGSWIAPDLSVWVGHPEKNRAWAEIRRVRDRFRAAGSASGMSSDRLAGARDEILAAEASDWFWWYGDDHQSAHKDEFDTLFRSHLIRAHNLLGLSAPAAIRRTLRSAPPEGIEIERPPYVRPSLDGRDTHFYEWRDAELFDAASDQGADHRIAYAMRRVLFGLDEGNLYVRVDGLAGNAAAGPPRSLALTFTLPRRVEARVPLTAEPKGALEWAGEGAQGAEDRGEYAMGSILEVRVPLARLNAVPGAAVQWSVALSEGGAVAEVIPRSGELSTHALDPDFAVANWSAT